MTSRLSKRIGVALAASLCLASCATDPGGLSVRWADEVPSVRETSGPAECPDINGRYQAAGRVLSRSTDTIPADLHDILAVRLAVQGLGDPSERRRGSRTNLSVVFEADATGWDILVDGDEGNRTVGHLAPAEHASVNPVPSERRGLGTTRYNGCSAGRLWVASTATFTQYENLNTTRHFAVLVPDATGLTVDLLTERYNIGLLPWGSTKRSTTRYRFDRVFLGAA